MSRAISLILCLFCICAPCISAVAENPPQSAAPAETATVAKKITIEAIDQDIQEVIKSVAKQSGEKIVFESAVKGKATLSLKDAELSTALNTLAKASKLEWRQLYISADSKLLDQPDRLAATARLIAGLSYPDMLISSSSNQKVNAYLSDKKAIQSIESETTKKLGLVCVYLISNDAAAAQAALKQEKTKAVEEYTQMSQKLMDMFSKMSPEEREQAMLAGISQFEQMDPGYMSSVMQTLMNSDPEMLRRIVARQTEMLFGMSEEDRRAMMKMNMQAAGMLTPEQQQILAEDARAVMQDIQSQQAGQ